MALPALGSAAPLTDILPCEGHTHSGTVGELNFKDGKGPVLHSPTRDPQITSFLYSLGIPFPDRKGKKVFTFC